MEINKEREAFEKIPMIKEKLCWHIWFSGIDNKYDSYLDKVEEDRNFLNGAWMMFQAKATPEGFVLVPKESLKVALYWMDENIDAYHVPNCAFAELFEHKPILENALEAQEQSHDNSN